MSLIADSLKKALKEKSFKINPGINLLKNLGEKSKPPRFDAKEVKKFVVLIIIPASVLAYLLVANPFGPKQRVPPKPPVIAQTPPPVVVTPEVKTPSLETQKSTPDQEPGKGPVIEPGMKEILITELETQVARPKPVPAPKKQMSSAARVEIKEPPDFPPVKKKLRPKPPAKIKKKIRRPIKPEQESKPPDKEKIVESFAPETREPEKSNDRVAALAPQNKVVTFPTTPEPDLFKNSDYYFNRAIFYQQSRDWEKALSNYAEAATLNPDNPDIYNNMGVIYKEQRQYDRAIEEFLRAVYLNPNYAKPYNNIGVVYYAKEDFSSAIRNYQKALSIDPENLEALNNLAVAFKKLGQLEKAQAVLNQALKTGADHAGTHYNMAVLFEETGNIKSAIHFYQRFSELGSTSHPSLVEKVNKHIETLK